MSVDDAILQDFNYRNANSIVLSVVYSSDSAALSWLHEFTRIKTICCLEPKRNAQHFYNGFTD